VSVVVFNERTNRAATATLSPGRDRVLAVETLRANEVPFVREDAEQALTLAKASAEVRRAVGADLERFTIVESGSDDRAAFVAQALPLRSTAAGDPCTNDRCVDLIFRTENGYLGVRAHVDLTKRNVTVAQDGGQHR
jgi:hypothetical protein